MAEEEAAVARPKTESGGLATRRKTAAIKWDLVYAMFALGSLEKVTPCCLDNLNPRGQKGGAEEVAKLTRVPDTRADSWMLWRFSDFCEKVSMWLRKSILSVAVSMPPIPPMDHATMV